MQSNRTGALSEIITMTGGGGGKKPYKRRLTFADFSLNGDDYTTILQHNLGLTYAYWDYISVGEVSGIDGLLTRTSTTNNLELTLSLSSSHPDGFTGTIEICVFDMEGIAGKQGEKGDTGAKGAKGATGNTGADGKQGIQGERGERGEKGEKGESGFKYANTQWVNMHDEYDFRMVDADHGCKWRIKNDTLFINGGFKAKIQTSIESQLRFSQLNSISSMLDNTKIVTTPIDIVESSGTVHSVWCALESNGDLYLKATSESIPVDSYFYIDLCIPLKD